MIIARAGIDAIPPYSESCDGATSLVVHFTPPWMQRQAKAWPQAGRLSSDWVLPDRFGLYSLSFVRPLVAAQHWQRVASVTPPGQIALEKDDSIEN